MRGASLRSTVSAKLVRSAPMTTSSQRKKAPGFTAKSSAGRDISLHDYLGKYLVLYFYPKSFTPGCTIETVAFRDATEELRALGAEILGVSTDPVETQCSFAQKHGATFPILADEDRAIARAYDTLFPFVERNMRVTFVIDPQGAIAARFHHELLFKKHITDAVAFLKAQQR